MSRWGRGLQIDNSADTVAGVLKGKVSLSGEQRVSMLLLHDVSSPFIKPTITGTH